MMPVAMNGPVNNHAVRKVYSVPRRYDLATMFVISLAFGLLFAGMRALRWPPEAALVAGFFIFFVGAAQAILFKGARPRLASVLAGVVFWIGCVLISGWVRDFYSMAFAAVFWGSILGYFVGTFIGGVFLVADVLRRVASSSAATKRNEIALVLTTFVDSSSCQVAEVPDRHRRPGRETLDRQTCT